MHLIIFGRFNILIKVCEVRHSGGCRESGGLYLRLWIIEIREFWRKIMVPRGLIWSPPFKFDSCRGCNTRLWTVPQIKVRIIQMILEKVDILWHIECVSWTGQLRERGYTCDGVRDICIHDGVWLDNRWMGKGGTRLWVFLFATPQSYFKTLVHILRWPNVRIMPAVMIHRWLGGVSLSQSSMVFWKPVRLIPIRFWIRQFSVTAP